MEIFYANSRIEKMCTNDKVALKELGRDGANVLRTRLKQMLEAENRRDHSPQTNGILLVFPE